MNSNPDRSESSAQDLYIQHLRDRLSQGEVFRVKAHDLEREVKSLTTQLEIARRRVENCSENHVDRDRYLRLKERAKALERNLKQLRQSRSYKVARRLSSILRSIMPSSGVPSAETGKPDGRERSPVVSATGSDIAVESPRRPMAEASSDPAVVLFDCRGLDMHVIADAAGKLLQLVEGANVICVQDSLNFGVARERGFRIEYVPRATELARFLDDESAEEVTTGRWDEILDQYNPGGIYRPIVATDGLTDVHLVRRRRGDSDELAPRDNG